MNQTRYGSAPAAERVRVLPEDVARKIAAGEVIDRPYAAVRELLDNALDAGATEITLSLEGGGIRGIRVVDNGFGMTPEDLELCWLPHATSKIRRAEDLDSTGTLGFRGEALAGLAACSRLEVVSAPVGKEAHRLVVHGGKLRELAPFRGPEGTAVQASELFYNIPARRHFLKSVRGETAACRRSFHEKATAHPAVAFRLMTDGVLKTFLPSDSPTARVAAAWPTLGPPDIWSLASSEGPGFTMNVVLSRPELSRKDRQYIHIYVNRRRISEFSLVQAVVQAFDPWMPGGDFPAAFVFLEVDPALADFNIHPAKREVRFRDPRVLRHRLVETIRGALTGMAYGLRTDNHVSGPRFSEHSLPSLSGEPRPNFASTRVKSGGDEFSAAARLMRRERAAPHVPPPGESPRYLGQLMGLFLLAEGPDSLYVVDQHAAHERILYDRFRKAAPESEVLLIPQPLELEPDAAVLLEARLEELAAQGLVLKKGEGGSWLLTALPRVAQGLETRIVEFLESGTGDNGILEKELWADLACKAAIKDGEILDDNTAHRLLADTFALETPYCPHGRPVWFEMDRSELFKLLRRI